MRKASFLFLLFALLTSPVWAQRTVSYSTYIGSPNAQESINHIAVDSGGNAYFTLEDYDDTGPSHDFVVGKINRSGTTEYTTVLGTFHSEEGATGITVDAAGNAYVTGWAQTYAKDHPRFPALNALQADPGGGVDAVIVKLDPKGKVVFSTYLGGSGDDYGRAIALDAAGNIYVAGTTAASSNAPANIFLTEIDATGSTILYSKNIGGDGDDSVAALSIDTTGNIYLAGSSRSSSRWNGYAMKLNPTGTSLVYSFSWSDLRRDHVVTAAALDRSGNLYIAEDGLIRKLNSAGDAFVYTKNIPTGFSALAVDGQGNIYTTGRTGNVLSVLRISTDGRDLVTLSSLKGTEHERGTRTTVPGISAGTAVAVMSNGAVYVGGYSESYNFPTTNGSTRSAATASSSQDAILLIFGSDR